jgi:hypothetical protein
MLRPVVCLYFLCAGLTGCANWLPRTTIDSPVVFTSFEQAGAAAGRIVPRQTSVAELKDFGFDPLAARNVTYIPYPEIAFRLTPNPNIPLAELDPGVAQCIRAQTACQGYLFRFERQDRRREGNFVLDFLNVRRTTRITGWWFEALVVVSNEKVLFRNIAGQPQTERIEEQINPLGPLQSVGEAVGASTFRR